MKILTNAIDSKRNCLFKSPYPTNFVEGFRENCCEKVNFSSQRNSSNNNQNVNKK